MTQRPPVTQMAQMSPAIGGLTRLIRVACGHFVGLIAPRNPDGLRRVPFLFNEPFHRSDHTRW